MSQTKKLLDLLMDEQPHRTDQILEVVYGSTHLGIARIGARIDDLKKKGFIIKGYRDPKNRALYFYHLIKEIKKDLFQ